jgi:hypothetical protein
MYQLAYKNIMKMKPEEMIQLLNTAKEDNEKLEELGDYLCELADDDKKIDSAVIEALFKIHERLKDPPQSLFNALESAVMGSQEKSIRKQALISLERKLNHCNIQLVGTGPKAIKLLKELQKHAKLDKEWRGIIEEIIQESEEN